MGLSAFDKSNIGVIVAGHGDWFTARLLRLIASADPVNRDRIRISFPEEVSVFEAWFNSPGIIQPGVET